MFLYLPRKSKMQKICKTFWKKAFAFISCSETSQFQTTKSKAITFTGNRGLY